jgi:plastocyanin
VRGRLVPPHEGAAPPGEAILVFLEPLEPATVRAPGARSAVLRSGEHELAPAVLAVQAGDSLRFTNDTEIYHRIFSYSESNPFDLGVMRRGDARSVRLAKPGIVRIYCSLHPAERATVFVAPYPHFATFQPPAGYEIRDVPPGRYRLHAWGEGAAPTSQPVTVLPGAAVAAEVAGWAETRE